MPTYFLRQYAHKLHHNMPSMPRPRTQWDGMRSEYYFRANMRRFGFAAPHRLRFTIRVAPSPPGGACPQNCLFVTLSRKYIARLLRVPTTPAGNDQNNQLGPLATFRELRGKGSSSSAVVS